MSKSSGININNIRTSHLEDIPIPIPPLDEQRRIVAKIEELFTQLDAAEAALKRASANLKRYRQSLLQAAVTGELTRDWRAAHAGQLDPASALLERIRAERRAKWEAEQRARGKDPAKMTYDEPQPPSADGLPALPEGWCWVSVEQLLNVVRGGSPRPAGDPKYFGGSIPWITVGNLTADENIFLNETNLFVTEEGKEKSRFIEIDTLLLTNSGATLGVPKISKISGCINDGIAALLEVDYPLKTYLYYFFHTQTKKLRSINQGAAQPNLNTAIIKKIIVPLPPINEMKEILNRIEEYYPLERQLRINTEKSITRISRLRQSILQRAFSGQL